MTLTPGILIAGLVLIIAVVLMVILHQFTMVLGLIAGLALARLIP